MIKFFGNDVWQLISQSDKMTWFVLFTLLSLSVFSWTILFYKLIIWRSKKKQIRQALIQIKDVRNFEDLLLVNASFSNSFVGYYLAKNLSFLKTSMTFKKSSKFDFNENEWDFLKQVSNNTIDDVVLKEESFLPILSITAAISPLLGLFGTVWGLVHAFIDISKKQSADIITVAPGIAEALITTLAGLLVAIPTLSMYYYLKLRVVSIEQSLVIFSDKFLSLIQNIFMSKTNHEPNIDISKTNINIKEYENA